MVKVKKSVKGGTKVRGSGRARLICHHRDSSRMCWWQCKAVYQVLML